MAVEGRAPTATPTAERRAVLALPATSAESELELAEDDGVPEDATPPPPSRRPTWFCVLCRRIYAEPHATCPDDGRPVVENLAGRVLAERYALRRLIGVGGMGGSVWQAWQLSTQRAVAVKVLPPRDEEAARRFEREARIVSSLNHPHITTVHDYGRASDGKLYLVMELLEGQTLRRLLRRGGPLGVRRVLRIADQVLRGLEHAHRRNVVHRDLKTSNLFLAAADDEHDFAKILDFGIATYATPPTAGFEESATPQALAASSRPDLVGTPYYFAPEQLVSGIADARTDLYAFGVVLFAMLTGEVPFRAESRVELFREILAKEAPFFAHVRPDLDIPGPLERVVRQALAKDPDARFASAHELRLTLRSVRHGLGMYFEDSVDAMPTVTGPAGEARSLASASRTGPVPPPTPPRPTASRRRRALVLAAAIGLPLLVGGTWAALELTRPRDATFATAPARPPDAPPPFGAAPSTAAARVPGPASEIAGRPAPVAAPPVAPAPAPMSVEAGPPATAPEGAPSPAIGTARLARVLVRSVPPGAEVRWQERGGMLLGRTPLTVALPIAEATLALTLEGHRAATLPLDLARLDTEGPLERTVALAPKPPRAAGDLRERRARVAPPPEASPGPPPVPVPPTPDEPGGSVQLLDEPTPRERSTEAPGPAPVPGARKPRVELLDEPMPTDAGDRPQGER